MENYGFNTLTDKSIKASKTQLKDLEILKQFSSAQYLFSPVVDDGFTNDLAKDSYEDYERNIYLGESITYKYKISEIALNKSKPLIDIISQIGFLGLEDKKYKVYINKNGDIKLSE